MSRVPKATANQFVKEATVGLLVVGALLALMVHALFRRFGVWQPSAHPKEVVAARVYTRIPTAANANASTEANPQATAVAQTRGVRVPAPTAGREASESAGAGGGQSTGELASASGSSAQPSAAATRSGAGGNSAPIPSPFRPTETIGREVGHPNPAQENRGPEAPDSGAGAARPWPLVRSVGSPEAARVPEGGSGRGSVELPAERVVTHGSPSGAEEAPSSPFRAVSTTDLEARRGANQAAGTFPIRTRESQPDPKWTVRLEDSSFSYCGRVYGDPQWFRALEAWLEQRGGSFDGLPDGQPFAPPAVDELARVAPELVPRSHSVTAETPPNNDGASYVATGDESLFDIAARVYGQAGRYVELIELNPQSDLARRDPLEPLPKGTRLHLPVVR
ncbi:MAG: hypothetical protein KDA83_06710 [Planctomycetales bacterium]|nr:hypothetical protein [Planctomycetales bacterium]